MSSRLFKHQMASSNVRQPVPHLLLADGKTYKAGPTEFTFIENSVFTNSMGVLFNENNKMLFVNISAAPYYRLYKTSNGTYTPIVLPLTFTGGVGARFSKDGQYLMVELAAAPFMAVFKKNADDTFTQVSIPALATYCQSSAINDDGSIIAVAPGQAPWLTFYIRGANGAFTKSFYDVAAYLLPDPFSLTAGITFAAKNVLVYSRTSNKSVFTFTVAANGQSTYKPTNINVTYGNSAPVMSPDRTYMAIPGVFGFSYWRHDGAGNFVSITIPQPSFTTVGGAFSKDMKYMAVFGQSAPYLEIYKIAGEVLTKMATPVQTSFVRSAAFIGV